MFNTSMKISCPQTLDQVLPKHWINWINWAFPAEFAGVHLGQFAAWATSFAQKTLDHVNGAQVVLVKQEARDEQSDGWLF